MLAHCEWLTEPSKIVQKSNEKTYAADSPPGGGVVGVLEGAELKLKKGECRENTGKVSTL
jgi:hypothetical protein